MISDRPNDILLYVIPTFGFVCVRVPVDSHSHYHSAPRPLPWPGHSKPSDLPYREPQRFLASTAFAEAHLTFGTSRYGLAGIEVRPYQETFLQLHMQLHRAGSLLQPVRTAPPVHVNACAGDIH